MSRPSRKKEADKICFVRSVSRKEGKKYLLRFFFFVEFVAALVLSSSLCRYYALEKRLDPEHSDFFSKVRYIMTEKEKRIFLELPLDEMDAWIKEFWQRRDPTPDTEENEFKMEYFDRIEQATELFKTEPKPGWMTDRGRIYILFGPPMDRITYPMGGDPYSQCREVWYYGNFPVVFVDEMCTGQFKLITYDLTSLREINLLYMHEINLAEMRYQQTIYGDQKLYNFKWRLRKTVVQEDRFEGIIQITVPYASIWFSYKDNQLFTTLDLHLVLRNAVDEVVWEHRDSYSVKTTEDKLSAHKSLRFRIDVPFVLTTDELGRLRSGKNTLSALLVNLTGKEELRKVMNFEIK
jgi:GWxTD domain-containing protein